MINKSMVSRAIISKIEDERNPNEIRTKHVVGYKSPLAVFDKKNDKEFTPDITAIFENETIIYEIELDTQMSVVKWQTFSSYARKNNGSLYLVVPNILTERVKGVLDKNEVNAGIITFATETNEEQ